jgi:hypothetical protein
VKSLVLADFVANVRQPPSQDVAGDKKEVHSSGNKEDMAANVEDSALKGKEKVAELPKVTKKWDGSRKSRGTGEKSLVSRHFEAQHRAELEMPSEATTTISMPKSN